MVLQSAFWRWPQGLCEWVRCFAVLEVSYVVQERRQSEVGRQLLTEAEAWAKSRGCTELASDALVDNTVSQDFHRRLGFVETQRFVCFRKNL